MYCLFCDVSCIVCVYMCTVLLPPGGYPIAVNKYIITYNKVRTIVCNNTRLRVQEIADDCGISVGSCDAISSP